MFVKGLAKKRDNTSIDTNKFKKRDNGKNDSRFCHFCNNRGHVKDTLG